MHPRRDRIQEVARNKAADGHAFLLPDELVFMQPVRRAERPKVLPRKELEDLESRVETWRGVEVELLKFRVPEVPFDVLVCSWRRNGGRRRRRGREGDRGLREAFDGRRGSDKELRRCRSRREGDRWRTLDVFVRESRRVRTLRGWRRLDAS